MLAYVFWHCPRDGADRAAYEARLGAFHRGLPVRSASFRLGSLPFARRAGYEDWYLVPGWHDLGELGRAAISDEREVPHAAVAAIAREGWGSVYALVRGEDRPPMTARWISKPREQSYDVFLDQLPTPTVWQRQLLLGPAPEFCVVDAEELTPRPTDRIAVYPNAR